jgi:hypothetical protein
VPPVVVPEVNAAAGCITDPYTYYTKCGGCVVSRQYWRACHVYSNCTVKCNPICDVVNLCI